MYPKRRGPLKDPFNSFNFEVAATLSCVNSPKGLLHAHAALRKGRAPLPPPHRPKRNAAALESAAGAAAAETIDTPRRGLQVRGLSLSLCFLF